MKKYVIVGRKRLRGNIKIGGSKNAVLPILAATVLIDGQSIIHNCPDISDTHTSIDILNYLGCKTAFANNTLIVDARGIDKTRLPSEHVEKMRSSIIFTGALLSRFGEFSSVSPGGCRLGLRPIDLHLNAFEQLGANIFDDDKMICAKAEKLVGENICLNFPSVGATQNAMLAAVFAKGTTIITNAAREPEIVDLQSFLNAAGAKISGAGEPTILIDGVKKLNDVEYKIMPDRIVAGTYLVAGAITRGHVCVNNVNPKDLLPVTTALTKMGAKIVLGEKEITIDMKGRPIALPHLITAPHPEFPTDMQPQFAALMATASGTSSISENMFEARDAHIPELIKMGANITNFGGSNFIIEGIAALHGKDVCAKDLRGGAALVLAGLAAHGVTTVHNACYVKRGYENIVQDLTLLGAGIKEI